jgi:hypothetical protein
VIGPPGARRQGSSDKKATRPGTPVPVTGFVPLCPSSLPKSSRTPTLRVVGFCRAGATRSRDDTEPVQSVVSTQLAYITGTGGRRGGGDHILALRRFPLTAHHPEPALRDQASHWPGLHALGHASRTRGGGGTHEHQASSNAASRLYRVSRVSAQGHAVSRLINASPLCRN